MGRLVQLEQKVDKALKRLWENESELKQGLDSAEFNLRAHQKVMNALAIDIDSLRSAGHFHLPVTEDEVPVPFQLLSVPQAVQVTEVEIEGTEETPPSTLRRMNWEFYHGEVKKDLDVLEGLRKQQEAAELEVEKGVILPAVALLVEKVPPEVAGEVARRIHQGEDILRDGEGKVLELSRGGRILAVETLLAASKVKEEPEAPPSQPDTPEGAEIFGG